MRLRFRSGVGAQSMLHFSYNLCATNIPPGLHRCIAQGPLRLLDRTSSACTARNAARDQHAVAGEAKR